MFRIASDLSLARILISNDDGIAAPGLALLEEVARQLSSDVWVVAPESEQSGAGHSLTLHSPLRLSKVGEQRYTVSGTPTDCVLLAVNHLLRDHKPTLVLSGVNRGANLADDVTYSGTVAAAMEGTLLGIPSIAFSQVFTDADQVPWETARHHAPALIRDLVRRPWRQGTLVNVNFPPCAPGDVSGIQYVAQGRRKVGDALVERLDPRQRPYLWIGPQRSDSDIIAGTDLAAIEDNAIAVTPLCIDLTDSKTLQAWGTAVNAAT